ncbi:XdhC family protein [Nocardia jinanensis]|uniref:Xanthine dehydrogenase n=1 Tax=Nocardia jinanensis TaxID=382504 RepID=A0A917RMD6_9NOCA|nr:XdhC family protein [Nocardia jinanensis]GGL13982.1 xanthine dehydrogenase [Nocardia jinanensis]
MREILDQLVMWNRENIAYAVATVIQTFGSAPRGPGAAMAVSENNVVVGSISGGCVESAVVAIAADVIASGAASYQRFGVSDDDAFAVGLTCGGTIEVFVVPHTPAFARTLDGLHRAVHAQAPVALGTTLSGPNPAHLLFDGTLHGSTGSAALDRAVESRMAGLLAAGASDVVECSAGERCHSTAGLFVTSFAPPPRMIVFGAIDFAHAVVRVGKLMGYFVTLCDARPAFATRARFPEADEIVIDWPHRYLRSQHLDPRAALCVLTHDEKFDVPLLEYALRLDVGYVGAMGSRRTCLNRERELRLLGLGDTELDRLHAPIGLDIGGRTPAETAISIAAEIVSAREGRPGKPLRESRSPIHARIDEAPKRAARLA